MKLAHDDSDCVTYLIGNHTIAERMFRYDPRVMMYAPLHTVIWEDACGSAWFTSTSPVPNSRASGLQKSQRSEPN